MHRKEFQEELTRKITQAHEINLPPTYMHQSCQELRGECLARAGFKSSSISSGVSRRLPCAVFNAATELLRAAFQPWAEKSTPSFFHTALARVVRCELDIGLCSRLEHIV